MTLQSKTKVKMGEEVFVRKLGNYFCRSTWIGPSLYFTILDGSESWAGQLEEDDFEAIMTKSGGRLGDIKELAQEAFAKNSEKFSFSIESGNKLVWKKVGGKAKIKIAEIDITSVSFHDTQHDILKFLIDSNQDLNTKNTHANQKCQGLEQDLIKSKKMLIEFEKGKNEIETKLYEQFLPILNEKKKKIAQLEKQGPSQRGQSQSEMDEDDYGDLTDKDEESDRDDADVLDEANGRKRKSSDSIEAEASKASRMDLDDSLDILNDSLV